MLVLMKMNLCQKVLNICITDLLNQILLFLKMSTVIERETYDEVDEEPVDEPANEPVNEPADEPVKATVVVDDFSSIASKTVKKLSANERARLIGDFEKGHDNPYFKVMRMKNGQIRVTKRREPLCSDVSKAHEQVGERIEKKFNKHLTNEQLLMEHIIDLETRYEKMRMKHKKLKKRYNALENTIYEDDDVPQDITPRQQPVAEPVAEAHDETVADEPEPETPTSSTPVHMPVRRARTTRSSWRNLVSYM